MWRTKVSPAFTPFFSSNDHSTVADQSGVSGKESSGGVIERILSKIPSLTSALTRAEQAARPNKNEARTIDKWKVEKH
ncbi:hypothetical protein QG37_03869 [Candidozyma auris]|nr:hypothetical protein QG37_03869 [[Candida] auris]